MASYPSSTRDDRKSASSLWIIQQVIAEMPKMLLDPPIFVLVPGKIPPNSQVPQWD